eukprot:CAMPEP_0119272054 /NCGR_PEP_ID=MMETSP1329-20130426/8392_1 /TAXON_ID=114041 /ORGANISM="Genus nov. species nov., Strain RCC1024" /LENGTH=230 /DNA_ID=CAMNT_0007272107 /DNA_START=159 /DNA_END=851 /DNA_ORIENTATION=-
MLRRLSILAASASALAPVKVSRRAFGGLALSFPASAFAYALPGADGDDVGAIEVAYFAAGDPRLLAPAFDAVKGVFCSETGAMKDGTKALAVSYDPTVVSYGRLVGQFWRAVDPTATSGQFGDASYKTAIYPTDRRERVTALASRQKLEESGLFGRERVATEVVALPFGGAREYGFVEDAEQNWSKKNAAAYASALEASGRNAWFAEKYKGGAFVVGGADPWPAGTFSSL